MHEKLYITVICKISRIFYKEMIFYWLNIWIQSARAFDSAKFHLFAYSFVCQTYIWSKEVRIIQPTVFLALSLIRNEALQIINKTSKEPCVCHCGVYFYFQEPRLKKFISNSNCLKFVWWKGTDCDHCGSTPSLGLYKIKKGVSCSWLLEYWDKEKIHCYSFHHPNLT